MYHDIYKKFKRYKKLNKEKFNMYKKNELYALIIIITILLLNCHVELESDHNPIR